MSNPHEYGYYELKLVVVNKPCVEPLVIYYSTVLKMKVSTGVLPVVGWIEFVVVVH